MKKEEEERKKRNKELKSKIKAKPRATFDRNKLNSNFFANAKGNKDQALGWAMDFGLEESQSYQNQGVALPGDRQVISQLRKEGKEQREDLTAVREIEESLENEGLS